MKTLLLVTLLAFSGSSQILDVRDSLEIRTWDQVNANRSILLHHIDLKSFSQSAQVKVNSLNFIVLKQSNS